ncbi:MAG: DegT/DnrJ/EryC1/StrS family aminotransferase [Polyangiaceae bacterium]|jgi:dTDP-4-amino-4,6-dideoxygalactose transaminase
MTTTMDPSLDVLAMNGGRAVRTTKFPVVYDGSGRLFDDLELGYLREVLASGALGRWGGTKTLALEKAWAERAGCRHALAVSSGSASIHVALRALQLPRGSHVITSPITDIGTVLGIFNSGLVPRFVDVDPSTGLIDPDAIDRRGAAAILPVHLFGQTDGIERIHSLGLPVIEDASQAHFSTFAGQCAGSTGAFGCFSLQQSKVVSCGEGGIVVTNDDGLEALARLAHNKGWDKDVAGPRAYRFIGSNYRMSELQAAVALAQLSKANEIIARRRTSFAALTGALRGIPGIRLPVETPGRVNSWWSFWMRIDESKFTTTPGRMVAALRAEGIPFALGYIGHPLYRTEAVVAELGNTRPLPGAEDFCRTVATLSWNERIERRDADDVAAAVQKVVDAFARRGV